VWQREQRTLSHADSRIILKKKRTFYSNNAETGNEKDRAHGILQPLQRRMSFSDMASSMYLRMFVSSASLHERG